MKKRQGPEDLCRCLSGLTYAECCGPQRPTLVPPEDSFDAAAIFAKHRDNVLGAELADPLPTLLGAALTVTAYLEQRRDDPRFRRYFRSRQFYENILGNLRFEETALLHWLLVRAPFDLRASPSRRAPASIFLEGHADRLPAEAVRALRALLRARDEFARVEKSGGRTFLKRLRDGRRLPCDGDTKPKVGWCLGRLVELDGRYHFLMGGPMSVNTEEIWREAEEMAVAWYARRDRRPRLMPHTVGRKATLLALLLLEFLQEVNDRARQAPPLDARSWRRLIDEMNADPDFRREEALMRREASRLWFELPQKVLGNQTPRSLAATPEGKARLEALIARWERNPFGGGRRLDLRSIRRRLGLASRKPPAGPAA